MELGMIAIAILMGLGVLGPAIAQGLVGAKTVEAMARQPEMAGQLRTTMILAMGLIEALAIYVLLIAFILVCKL